MSGFDLLSEEGYRLDGRRSNELRRIQCRLNVIKNASGSAYFEQGFTKVLATVYGPHEPKLKNVSDVIINCQYSMATFSTSERKSRPRGDRKSTEKTVHLQQIFEAAILTDLYSKCQIDIFIEVLQCDGGSFAASINAACLALIDAGIPMRDFVSACNAAYTKDQSVLDLNTIEENSGESQILIGILPKSEDIVYMQVNARLHEERLPSVINSAIEGCKDIYHLQYRTVRDHAVRMSVDDLLSSHK